MNIKYYYKLNNSIEYYEHLLDCGIGSRVLVSSKFKRLLANEALKQAWDQMDSKKQLQEDIAALKKMNNRNQLFHSIIG